VAAAAMQVITPTTGFTADVYGSPPGGRPQALGDFTKVGSFTSEKGKNRIDLRTDGRRYRYYLVWITALPPEASVAKIGEIRLFRRTG
jgi:eukaryotic-like serine/threonine-protein kinase